MSLRLRLVADVDTQLAEHGYRLQWGPNPEGWHVIAQPDPDQPAVCLGWMPDHRIPHLPDLLEQHGWPTRPALPWECPSHREGEPEDE